MLKQKACLCVCKSRLNFYNIIILVRLSGIEPPHAAPEAAALSTELQAHYNICIIPQLSVLYNLGAHALAFILQTPFFMLQLAY